ncbi:MAG: hypothetical protein JWN13_3809, partial [Betaproteobacteria bacterium]|nr:hypothetical protein [Betaproteobacteria bacterium]
MTKSTWLRGTVAIMLLGGATGAHAHEAMAGKPPEQLGRVEFPVSCNAAAQQ